MSTGIDQFIADGNQKYGIDENELCKWLLGCDKSKIRKQVILSPWWEPVRFDSVKTELISEGYIKIWDLTIHDRSYTYIKTGIGAGICADVILALGAAGCRKILFVGSAGSLSEEIHVGDLVIPDYSVCGDGYCKYLARVIEDNCYGERNYPEKRLFEHMVKVTDKICKANHVEYHVTENFSIETAFARYGHLEQIMELGVKVIESETSAAFKAANICHVPMCAIFCISDNVILKQPIYAQRTKEEKLYRNKVSSMIIPQIIYWTLT